jgi:serine/threonine-protein kinase
LELANGERFHSTPQVLPGKNAVLFTVYGTPPTVERASIEVVSLADGRRKTIARGGTTARYLSTGHLVYTNGNTMFAVPFDLDALETRGTAVPILNDVAFDSAAGLAQFTVSNDGILVYRRASGGGRPTVSYQWLDAVGTRESLQARPGVYFSPSLSPDGKRLAMVALEGSDQDIWIYDTQRDTMTRLTFGSGQFVNPIWSPDGRFIVFGSIGNGLSWVRADGAGQPQALIEGNKIQLPTSFTPDGSRLAFYEVEGTPQIWTVPIEADGEGLKAGPPQRYLTTQFADFDAVFSPDGRWLAYGSNETGQSEVYVRAFPAPVSGQGGRWQISNNGGSLPTWSHDGRDILYRAGDQVLAVGYRVTGDVFVADRPRLWGKLGGATGFKLGPDTKRLLVSVPTVATGAPKQEHTVVFLQNFFDELRRRVPTAR